MARPTINPNTSVWLDAMRAAAAQAVVLGHLYQLFFFGSHAGQESPITTALHSVIIRISSYSHDAVMVFFVLSGYLVGGSALKAIHDRNFAFGNFLRDRLARLWTVVLPTLLVTLVLDDISTHYGKGTYIIANWASLFPQDWLNGDPWSLKRFLSNAAFLTRVADLAYGTNVSLWSVTNEFWYYVTLPAMALLILGDARHKWIGLGIIAALLAVLVALEAPLAWPFVVGFGIWMMGAILRRLPHSAITSGIGLIVLAACFAVAYAGNLQQGSMPRDILVAGITSCLIALSRHLPGALISNIASFFAKFSFSLYAIHLPVIVLVLSFDPLTSLNRVYGAMDLMRFIAYFSITNIAAYAFWLCFERRTETTRIWLGKLGLPALRRDDQSA